MAARPAEADWTGPFGWLVPALFACGALQFPALANLALGLMLLALLRLPAAAGLWRAPPVLLLALFMACCGAGLLLAWPEARRAADLDGLRRFVELWWFVPLALWVGASDRRAVGCLLVAALVFVLGRLVATDWGSPPVPGGERVRLGFSSINHFAQYAAALLLGLLCFAPRVWRRAVRGGGVVGVAVAAVWLAGVLLAAYWVLVSGSRGVWAALLLTLFVLAWVVGARAGGRALLGALVALGLVLALLYAALAGVIGERLQADAASREAVLTGRLADVDDDALGLRARMLAVGWVAWREAPWLGHGPGAVTELLAREGGALGAAGFRHLHNVFADTFARLGVLGAGVLQALFLWVPWAAWRAWRGGTMRFDLWLALSSMLLLALLCNLTDLRLFGWDWRNFWVLIAGLACGPALSQRPATIPPRNRNMPVTAG